METPSVKDRLRTKIRTERRALPASTTASWDKVIVERCTVDIDWSKVKSLHCYLAVPQWREVDTWSLIKYVWQNYPKILVAAPRILENQKMESIELTPNTKLVKNTVGITEPENGKTIPENFQFDVIITPTLAFDDSGYRLGSGSGHYDRFLKNQPGASPIGLCYQNGLLENGFAREPHDIPMHKIITEKAVYDFLRR